jgi:uncharacterized protein (DUF697 family)
METKMHLDLTKETMDQLEQVKKECFSMVTKRAFASGGAALVPVPGTDIVADIALFFEMIPAINKKFGIDLEMIDAMDPQWKVLIYRIIQAAGAEFAGRIVTKELIVLGLRRLGKRVAVRQVAKWVPIIGQAVAVAISISVFKLVGNSHVKSCYEIAKQFIEEREKK